MRRFFKGNREADRESSLGKDRTPTTYISNVTPAPTQNLPGRDFVRLPDETGSSVTDTLRVSVADPNYSRLPSFLLPNLIFVNFVSILQDICRGRSHSLEDTFPW